MKILVVAPTPFFADRGTHIRILEEALALEKMGHQITIATYHIGKNISQEIDTKIDVRRIRRLFFWYKKMEAGPDWQKIILDLMLIGKVFHLARAQRPDIIHAHLHEGVMLGWIVQKLLFWRKIKLVVDFHGSLVNEMTSHNYLSSRILKRIFIFLEKFINRLGDFSIVSSWEYAEYLKKDRSDKKVAVIIDGVNLDRFENLPEKSEIKKELNLPLDKKIVIYAGGLVPNKGIDYLLDAAKKTIAKSSEIHFVIAGYPYEYVKKYLEKNDLFSRTTLISPLSYFDLPRILRAGDIGIDPKDSSVGQASGKILQYMAAGLPVICFDRENNRKYLGEGGYYADDVSAEGIAEGILYFFKNSEEALRRGEINKNNIGEVSWKKSAEKIAKIYQEI